MKAKLFGSLVAVASVLSVVATLAPAPIVHADGAGQASTSGFAESRTKYLERVRQQKADSMKSPSPGMYQTPGGKYSGQHRQSGDVGIMGSGQTNFYTWDVYSGTTTMGGAWYFNNGADYTFSNSYAESYWDEFKNACYSYAETNVVLARADAWCVLGNEFDYLPNAPAGTLVNVNVRAQGEIRGRVASSGNGSSSLLVRLTVFG